MDILTNIDILASKSIFALLIVFPEDEPSFIRPIGSPFGNGISAAIDEVIAKYPKCKIKYFERNGKDYFKYFKDVIAPEQYIH